MPDITQELLLIIILVAINAFFAGSELALISIRPVRIQHLADSGDNRAKAVIDLVDEPSQLLATIQVGITLAGFLASAAAAVSVSRVVAESLRNMNIPFLAQTAEGLSVVIVTVGISFFTLIFGELVPKRLALHYSETIALRVARPIRLLKKITSPAVKFLSWTTNTLVRVMGGKDLDESPVVSEEEIKLLVSEQGSLMEEEKSMIHSIFVFGDTIAREIMIPRTDVTGISEDGTAEEALRLANASGFSRLPVYQGDIDHITGIVFLKDLLKEHLENRGRITVGELVRPAYFIPEGKRVVSLLKELQARRLSMAVVVDEYGGTAGLVTMEDLLEEIVGDIHDEDEDEETVGIKRLSDTEALIDGRLNVEDVNDELALQLPSKEHYETIGGLVLDSLGRIPKAGDSLLFGEVQLIVERMENRRVARVKGIWTHPESHDGEANKEDDVTNPGFTPPS